MLVVERHLAAGGLTQTFSRNGFRWDVGVHYPEVGTEGRMHTVLDWLADGAIQLASLGAVYDMLHFPDGFEVQFPSTEVALKQELEEKFPDSLADLNSFLPRLSMPGNGRLPSRAMPNLLARLQGLWQDQEIRKW